MSYTVVVAPRPARTACGFTFFFFSQSALSSFFGSPIDKDTNCYHDIKTGDQFIEVFLVGMGGGCSLAVEVKSNQKLLPSSRWWFSRCFFRRGGGRPQEIFQKKYYENIEVDHTLFFAVSSSFTDESDAIRVYYSSNQLLHFFVISGVPYWRWYVLALYLKACHETGSFPTE